MSIGSATAPSLTLPVRPGDAARTSAAAASTVASPAHQANEVPATKSFAGRAVKLIVDVGAWAAKALGHAALASVHAFFKGVVFVGKKLVEGVKALHEAYQDRQALQAARRDLRAASAGAAGAAHGASAKARDATASQTTQAAQSPPRARRLDAETRDLQDRANLLKLPDVPTHDPNVAKPR